MRKRHVGNLMLVLHRYVQAPDRGQVSIVWRTHDPSEGLQGVFSDVFMGEPETWDDVYELIAKYLTTALQRDHRAHVQAPPQVRAETMAAYEAAQRRRHGRRPEVGKEGSES